MIAAYGSCTVSTSCANDSASRVLARTAVMISPPVAELRGEQPLSEVVDVEQQRHPGQPLQRRREYDRLRHGVRLNEVESPGSTKNQAEARAKKPP